VPGRLTAAKVTKRRTVGELVKLRGGGGEITGETVRTSLQSAQRRRYASPSRPAVRCRRATLTSGKRWWRNDHSPSRQETLLFQEPRLRGT
jgi:hypothetical protein